MAHAASHPRPQLARKRWQPLAAASSCTVARAGEAAACSQRIGLAPPENGQRILLHLAGGAGAELRVNGTAAPLPASLHGQGADITEALRPGKEQVITLRAPSAAAVLASGWWEVAPAQRITRVLAETVPTGEALNVTVSATAPGGVEVELRDGVQVVAAAKGATDEKLWLKPVRPRMWSPADPFLYQVQVRLVSGDMVASYAAMRTIALGKDASGTVRTMLNGQPYFFHGLEAATPPDPAAVLRLGYNTVRLRTLAPPSWYSDCDRAGLLIWQDLPPPESRTATLAVVEALRVYPAIALWTLFDEGKGQEAFGLDAARSLAGEVARLDGTRLVNGGSGWFDTGNGHVHAMHSLPGPAMFDAGPRRASVLARYGALSAATRGELRRDYRELMGKLSLFRALGLSAAIYSPGEAFLTRAGEEWLAAVHERMLANAPTVEELAGGGEPWEFTLAEAGAAREGWRTGAGSFGRPQRDVQPGTPWTSPAIRLRRNFAWKGAGAQLQLVHWAIRGAQFDVRLNGEPVLRTNGNGPQAAAFLALTSHPALRTGDNLITIDARRAPDSPSAAFDVRLVMVTGDKFGFRDPELSRRPEYPLSGIDNGTADLARLAPFFTGIRSRRGRPATLPPSIPFFRDLAAATPEQAHYALLSAPADGFDGIALRLPASTAAERSESELTLRNIQEWSRQQRGALPAVHLTGLTAADFSPKTADAKLFFLPTPEKPNPPAAVAITQFPGTEEMWLGNLRLLLQAAQSQWPLHVEPAQPGLFAYATYLLGVESKSPSAPVRLALPVAELDEHLFWPIGEPTETIPYAHPNRMKAPGTEIYQRRFANGMVAVNPGGQPQTLRLPTSLLDPATRLVSQRFEMPPRSARILLRPGTPGLADRMQ